MLLPVLFMRLSIFPKINELCSRLQLDCDNFQVENYPYRYSKLESEGDIHDGVCIISVLYFCVMNILIYFDEHSLVVARDNFCSLLCISKEFPFCLRRFYILCLGLSFDQKMDKT